MELDEDAIVMAGRRGRTASDKICGMGKQLRLKENGGDGTFEKGRGCVDLLRSSCLGLPLPR